MARILIVDDDESDILLQRTILEAANHEVRFAKDGYAALRELRAAPVDVVITDLQMPEFHGLQLITVLRDVDPKPVIVAASSTGPAQLDMAEMLGAAATVSKPIRADNLLAAVDRALAAR